MRAVSRNGHQFRFSLTELLIFVLACGSGCFFLKHATGATVLGLRSIMLLTLMSRSTRTFAKKERRRRFALGYAAIAWSVLMFYNISPSDPETLDMRPTSFVLYQCWKAMRTNLPPATNPVTGNVVTEYQPDWGYFDETGTYLMAILLGFTGGLFCSRVCGGAEKAEEKVTATRIG